MARKIGFIYRVFIKYCVLFPRVLPRQHSVVTDCTLVLRWELWRSLTAMQARGRGCSELWKKHNFSWTPCIWWPRFTIINALISESTNCFIWPSVRALNEIHVPGVLAYFAPLHDHGFPMRMQRTYFFKPQSVKT